MLFILNLSLYRLVIENINNALKNQCQYSKDLGALSIIIYACPLNLECLIKSPASLKENLN